MPPQWLVISWQLCIIYLPICVWEHVIWYDIVACIFVYLVVFINILISDSESFHWTSVVESQSTLYQFYTSVPVHLLRAGCVSLLVHESLYEGIYCQIRKIWRVHTLDYESTLKTRFVEEGTDGCNGLSSFGSHFTT